MNDTPKPPQRRVNRTSPKKLEIIENQAKAWEHRKAGKSYREIASMMGVTVQTAFRWVNEKSNAIENQTETTREEYRQMQLDDVTRAIELMWKQVGVLNAVNSSKDTKGVMDNVNLARARADTIRTLSNLLDRQSKLLGLDEPAKVQDMTPRDAPYIIFGIDTSKPPADE